MRAVAIIVTAVLAILASSHAYSETPPPLLVGKDQPAPFTGWLVSEARAATLISTIETTKELLSIEEERSHDLEALYSSAMNEQAITCTAAIINASKRSWWDDWGKGALGVTGGLLVGTMATYMVMSLSK